MAISGCNHAVRIFTTLLLAAVILKRFCCAKDLHLSGLNAVGVALWPEVQLHRRRDNEVRFTLKHSRRFFAQNRGPGPHKAAFALLGGREALQDDSLWAEFPKWCVIQ